jgi:hypothetical protein
MDVIEGARLATLWRSVHQPAIKPHRWHHGPNNPDPDLESGIQEIVGLHPKAPDTHRNGEFALSAKEKPSIHALERKRPTIHTGSATLHEHE